MVGRSGCGKSTLLNLVSKLDSFSSGQIQVSGEVTYIQQRDLLLPWRNVIENVLLPAEIRHRINPGLTARAHGLLKQMELDNCVEKYPSQLSGGMCQKVSLVRAFLQDCPVVLMDEPFSAIDFDARLRLAKDVRKFILETDRLAIFVTHNIEEAISIADRVLVIGSKLGSVVFDSKI